MKPYRDLLAAFHRAVATAHGVPAGHYVRFGNLVYVTIPMRVPPGRLSITGLPFLPRQKNPGTKRP